MEPYRSRCEAPRGGDALPHLPPWVPATGPQPSTPVRHLIRTGLGDTMARSSRGTTQRGQRDVFTQPFIARPTLQPLRTLGLLTPHQTLNLIKEDRREYHPSRPLRPAAAIRRVHARLLPKSVDRFGKAIRALPYGVRFAMPRNVAICIRRRIRKEVLHAIKRAGSASGRSRKRRNQWSNVTC